MYTILQEKNQIKKKKLEKGSSSSFCEIRSYQGVMVEFPIY